MKTIGLFEAKTRLSEICDTVAQSREPVTITRRGNALVRIEPIEPEPTTTISERRTIYTARYGREEEPDAQDFEPPRRSHEVIDFRIED